MMMTRDDVIAAGYRIENETIRDLGKFEGEHWRTVLAWALCGESGEDEILYCHGRPVSVFKLATHDRIVWDLEPQFTYLFLEQLDAGFVLSRPGTDREYKRLCKIAEEDDDEE